MTHLKNGDLAPHFLLRDQNGNQWSLGDFAQSWLVLFFYPHDADPAAAQAALTFRDAMPRLRDRGVKVAGVSIDTYDRHARFSERHALDYPLLSDAMHTTVEDYGVWRETGHGGRIRYAVDRTTFLIDPDGRIVKVYDGAVAERHPAQILEDIGRLEPSAPV